MLKRKITSIIDGWVKSKNSECLLIKGARQIGKTYAVEAYGREHYANFIEINFERNPDYKAIFDGSLEVDEMIKRISLFLPNVKFVEGKTLLFLDEIQACPNARTSLKFWAIDNRFDVVASGSLLGINYAEVSSFPVGYERQVEMHSLDFEEFLWAIGIDNSVISDLWTHFETITPVDDVVNRKMLNYMREYMVVGGMPAVVNKYIETSNMGEVHQEQVKIVNAYLNDIAKYASNTDKPKSRNCFLSIPKQLAKENTKFQYSVVEKGGTARKYANSIDWLRDAGYVSYCVNLSTIKFPLAAYTKPEQFRIYMNDMGLLISMYSYDMKRAIIDDTLSGAAKGGIYENLVADFLIKKGINLYYYQKDDNSVEIEFLLEKEAHPVPVEVKSNRGATASLNKIMLLDDIRIAYKFTSGNIGVVEKKVTLPIYMAMFL